MTNAARQQRGIASLLILLLVLVLCTGQTSGHLQSCKGTNATNSVTAMSQSSQVATTGFMAASTFAFSPAQPAFLMHNVLQNMGESDCELTSHLIQSSQPQDLFKLPIVLILLFALAVVVRVLGSVRTTPNGFPPVPQWRYRPHLHFCVFNE